MKIKRSNLIEPQRIQKLLSSEFALNLPLNVRLLRRGYNDTYLVENGSQRYVLRVYLNGKYYINDHNDFRWELDLIQFLRKRGVPVSAPIPRSNGDSLGMMLWDNGEHYYALFVYADGDPPRNASIAQATALGNGLGQLHAVANEFRSKHKRYHLNLEFLIERPMKLIREFFRRTGEPDSLAPFLPRVETLVQKIRLWQTFADEYGVIHGDPHVGNSHISAGNTVTIFDFDHGGYGWRAWDIATALRALPEEVRPNFRVAYASQRPVSAEEWEMVSIFEKIRPIWDRGDVLAMDSIWEISENPDTVQKRRIWLMEAFNKLLN